MSVPAIKPLVRTLLVSSDLESIDQLRHSLQELGINVEVSSDVKRATCRIQAAKYEGIIVDTQIGPDALEVFAAARRSPSNNPCVTFGLLPDSDLGTSAADMNIGFVLRKPFNHNDTSRIFRGAFALLLRERRRYFRCEAKVPVRVLSGGKETWFNSLNISEGGIALEPSGWLRPGVQVELRWSLPAMRDELQANGEV